MTMELAKYKNALTTMKQEEMASIAQAFAKAVMRDEKDKRTDSGVCSRLSGARMGRCHYQIRASYNDYFAVRIFIQNAYM